MRLLAIAIVSLMGLGGCTYKAQLANVGRVDVYEPLGEKIPGTLALRVETASLKRKFKTVTFGCSAHDFPVDASEGFRTAFETAMKQIFSDVKLVDRPLSDVEFQRGDYVAFATVRPLDFNVRLGVASVSLVPWLAAITNISARLSVDSRQMRVFSRSAGVIRTASGSVGNACDGGPDVIARATRAAIKKLATGLVERFASNPRVRDVLDPRIIRRTSAPGKGFQWLLQYRSWTRPNTASVIPAKAGIQGCKAHDPTWIPLSRE